MSEVLLPCPFCGGEAARITIGDDEPNNAGGDVIVCARCKASSHVEFGRKENLVSRWNNRIAGQAELVDDIAVMMSEFVTNWPPHKKVSTSLALIAKTLRAALNPPKHTFWGAGEVDCPSDIKAPNGELHTLRCKACHTDSPKDDRCFPKDAALAPLSQSKGD